MGKSTISMAILNSYVSLPEGTPLLLGSTKGNQQGTNMNQLQWGQIASNIEVHPIIQYVY